MIGRVIALQRDRPSGRAGIVVGLAGPVLVALVLTALAALVQAVTQGNISDIVLLFGINAIMVVGFQSFVGNTGIVSFGHVAFMALGAYTAGVLAVPLELKAAVLPDLPGFLGHLELPLFWTLVLGGTVAAASALVTGAAILRLSGAAASIATLGLLVIVNNVLNHAHAITRGPQSFYGVPQSTTFEWVFGTLVVAVALSALLKWSRTGLRARSVRDDPVAAEASGVRRLPARLGPFMFSAFLTGVGGALYAQDLTAFSPDSFFVAQITGLLVMAIIGGLGSISGVLLGATLISVLGELLRHVESGFQVGSAHVQAPIGVSQAVLGALLIVMLRWRPDGILGALELELDPRRWRRAEGPPRAAAPAPIRAAAATGLGEPAAPVVEDVPTERGS